MTAVHVPSTATVTAAACRAPTLLNEVGCIDAGEDRFVAGGHSLVEIQIAQAIVSRLKVTPLCHQVF